MPRIIMPCIPAVLVLTLITEAPADGAHDGGIVAVDATAYRW